jgi:cell division protease FtsH
LIALTKRLIEVESVDSAELRRIIDESTEGPLVVPGTFASPVRSPALEATDKIEVAGAE